MTKRATSRLSPSGASTRSGPCEQGSEILETRTLSELVHAVRDGSLSATDLVTASLESLERWQPVTNAASQVWAEQALAEAERLPDGELPLRGIPVLVKEHMDVAGHPSTACCEAFRDRVATMDAELVARLRHAGAIVVGKANMHELAASGTNHISACGPTHNPWDPRRLTGGSSGGSGAAVASRSVPLSLGTDTAGSIRIPASFCGITGLKPTQDRLSMHGVMPLAPTFGCPGPMAVSAEDVGLAYGVLVDQLEELPRMHDPVGHMRLCRVAEGYYAELVHPEVRRALDHVCDVLSAEGVSLVTGVLDDVDHALSVWGDIAWPEFVAAYPDLDLSRVGHQIADHYRYGQSLSEESVTAARARAYEIRAVFLAALRDVDALLLPCTAYPAPFFSDNEVDLEDGHTLNVFRGGPVWFTCPINVVGLPSLALPAGFSADNVPLGVQIVGRPGDEWTLLRLGSAFQARTDYHRRCPRLPAGSKPLR